MEDNDTYPPWSNEQRHLSLETLEAWWLDVLHRGYVWRSKHGLEAYFHQWSEHVTTELLFASYLEFAATPQDRRTMSRGTFGRNPFGQKFGKIPALADPAA